MKIDNLFLSCALAIGSYTASAQCTVRSKTDDFSGEKSLWTDKVKIAAGGVARLVKSKRDDDPTYRIYFSLLSKQGRLFMTITDDADMGACVPQSVAFKFADGKVLIKNTRIELQAVKSTLGEEHNVLFEITKDELRQLATGRISKLKITERMCSEHPVLEDELEDKPATTIQRDAACFLAELK